MEQIFQRIQEMYPEFIFTENAYKTASDKKKAYKDIGYDTILKMFKHLHEVLTPFYRGEVTGISERQVFERLKR